MRNIEVAYFHGVQGRGREEENERGEGEERGRGGGKEKGSKKEKQQEAGCGMSARLSAADRAGVRLLCLARRGFSWEVRTCHLLLCRLSSEVDKAGSPILKS